MIPAVLFTAAVFELPKWAEQQLRGLQIQFLWRHSTSTEASRHKINPALLHTPKQAGGVGPASILIACKTLRVKHAILWLTQRKDLYFSAWQAWVLRGTHPIATVGMSLLVGRTHHSVPGSRLSTWSLLELLSLWLAPSHRDQDGRQQRYTAELLSQCSTVISWSTPQEWILQLARPLLHCSPQMMQEEAIFWPTYSWADNPWILDHREQALRERKFDRLRPCAVADLHIVCIRVKAYSFVLSTVGAVEHQQVKLRRWGSAILLSAPTIAIGERLQVGRWLHLRNPPKLKSIYAWEPTTPSRVQGVIPNVGCDQPSVILLEQASNGIHWLVAADTVADRRTADDCRTLAAGQHNRAIVFQAHPRLHGIPWRVSDSVANFHVHLALKKQPFKRFKGSQAALSPLLIKLRVAARRSAWQTAVLQQTPATLWAHGNMLTAFQVWVNYRVAVMQLNLYHPGRAGDPVAGSFYVARG